MLNRTKLLLAAVVFAAGLGFVTQTSAQATTPVAGNEWNAVRPPLLVGDAPSIGTADCLIGYACGWTGVGATGRIYQWTAGYIWQEDGFPLAGRSDNAFRSLYNKSGSVIRYWDNHNCTGNNYWTMQPGESDASLGIYNAVISSVNTVPGRTGGTC